MTTIDNALTPSWGVSGSNLVRRFWWAAVWLAAATIAAVVLTVSAPNSPPYSARLFQIEWTPAVDGRPTPTDGATWQPLEGSDLPGGTGWLRARFHLSEAEAASGAATLILTGLFSASAELNGVPIGQKGQPGFSAAAERPGPIDAALPIATAARAGENELLLLVSAHNTRYRPAEIIHAMNIALSGAGPRRPLEHYAVAIAQVGVLLAMAFALLVGGVTRKNGAPLLWAGAAAAFLLAALASEMLRALWSYPYSLHVFRMLAVWLALTGFAGAVFAAAAARWSMALPWRALLLAVLATAARAATSDGLDAWAIGSLGAFGLATLWVLWPPARRGDSGAIALGGVILAMLALAWFRSAQLLDNGIYVLGVLTLLPFALDGIPQVRERARVPAAVLQCEDGSIACRDIVWIRAAGNYLEVKRADGAVVLLRGSLSRLGAAHTPVIRVHRSYAVNLDFAERVVAKTGSRYEVVLRDGARIPASRKDSAALRDRLRKGDPSKA